jgi:hypothetical protein
MKRITIYITTLLLLFSINNVLGQSIWSNPITGTNPNTSNPFISGDITDPYITVSGIGRGAGISGTNASDRYNAEGWSTSDNLSTSDNDYFEFTLTPNSGYKINFSSFVFTSRRSSTGPTIFTVRSSRDSYTTDIIIPITAESTATESSINLTSATFQSITDAVTFRVYAWSANATTGTYSINDFTFNGEVVSSCVPPSLAGAIDITENCGNKVFTYNETAPTDITFYWQTSEDGTATDDEVTTLNTTKTVITDNTSWYIRAQRTEGGCWSEAISANSESIKTLAVFDTHPQNISISEETATVQSISFTATVTAQASTTFVWQENNGSGWADITNGGVYTINNTELTISPVTISMSGYKYQLKAINMPCEVTSNEALLTVKKLPTIDDIVVTYPSTACGTAQIEVSATNTTGDNTGLSYTWYSFDASTDNDWVTLTDSAIYSGATTATLTIASTSGQNNLQYYVRVREGAVDCYRASSTVKTLDYVTTWNGSWSNGTPDLTKKAIIDNTYDTTIHGSFKACGCELTPSGALNIGDGSNTDYVILKGALINNGSVVVNNNANLIQINDDAINTGTITVKRESTPMNKYSYTYWGTPVSGQAMSGLYSGINNMFQWNQAAQNWGAVSGNMTAPNGYIARAPQSAPWNAQTAGEWNRQEITANFIGVPNNGVYSTNIIADTTTLQPYEVGAKMSYIGNPYPSAINIDKFFVDNTSVILPTIYLWTHASNPVLNGNTYSYASSDFAVYNGLGGVSTSPGTIPTGKVASGQGFFIRGTVIGGTATFRNNQRYEGAIDNPTAYPNNNFYRLNSQSESATNTTEKHRFWLNLTGSGAQFKQTLIGYATEATDQLDNLDGEYYRAGNTIDLYTISGTKELAIQSRALPFDEADTISMGYKVTTAGIYTLALESFDNLFENQDIYIKDNTDLSRHNLKDGSFEFLSDAGEFTSRFEIVFRASDLSVDNPNLDTHWIVYTKESQLHLESLGFEMKDVYIYDMLGRLIYSNQNINTTHHVINTLGANQVYIIKMVSEDNIVLVKKTNF